MSIDATVGKTIHVRSVNRLNNSDTISNFEVDISNTAITQETDADVVIRHVTIPFTVFNVNVNTQKLTIQESAATTFTTPTTTNLTIPANNYTGAQLATQLTTTINASANNTYSVTYNGQNGIMTFTETATGGANKQYFRFLFDNQTYKSNPSLLMGFSPPAYTTDGSLSSVAIGAVGVGYGSLATPLVAPNPCQLQPCNTIQLCIEGYNEGQDSGMTGMVNDSVVSIQCLVPFGFVLDYQPADSREAYHIRELFKRKRFKLRTNFGNGAGMVDLPLQSDWEVFMAVRRYRGLSVPAKPTVGGVATQPMTPLQSVPLK